MTNVNFQIIVVDFYAQWCMPCKMIAPAYEELSQLDEFSDVIFLKVDVDKVSLIAEKYQVTAMPTFLFLKDSSVASRFSGASIEKLTETIRSLL
jgi:thioredoxin 1